MPKIVLISILCFLIVSTFFVSIFSLNKNSIVNIQDYATVESIFLKLNNKSSHIQPDDSIFENININHSYEIPIITYHYVENVINKDDFIRERLSIKPQTFENQLILLKNKNYQPIWIKEIPLLLASSLKSDSKFIALTFDDAYGDFYTDVFPLIKKYNTKVTLYVIPNFINKPNYMTSNQLKEVIKSNLVEIGSHTLNHVDLPSVSSEIAYQEILKSKESLENDYSLRIETFCYPYGYYNDKVIELVKKAGYKAAVSEVVGTTQSKENLFYLSRIRVGGFDSVIN